MCIDIYARIKILKITDVRNCVTLTFPYVTGDVNYFPNVTLSMHASHQHYDTDTATRQPSITFYVNEFEFWLFLTLIQLERLEINDYVRNFVTNVNVPDVIISKGKRIK